MPRMPPCCRPKSSLRTCESIPGTGMCDPIRYTTKAPSRNHSRRFRSPNFPPLLTVAGLVAKERSPLPTGYSETLPPAASIAARAPRRCANTLERHFPRDLARQIRLSPTALAEAPGSPDARSPNRSHRPVSARCSDSRTFNIPGAGQDLKPRFGKAALQRHLAAFETHFVETTGT
jgi:hypothetical protein